MAATGEFLLVLDSTGTLHILSGVAEHEHDTGDAHDAEHEEHAFERLSTVKVIDTMPAAEGHSRVSITSSPSSDFAYIVNAETREIIVVHLDDAEIENRIKLSFTPAQVAWVGIASSEHDHDHEDDEAHSHD